MKSKNILSQKKHFKAIPIILIWYLTGLFSLLNAQPFITEWEVPEGRSTISFFITTSGDTEFSWTCGTESGLGLWTGEFDGEVKIDVQSTDFFEPLILSIAPQNLKRFYMCKLDWDCSENAKQFLGVLQWGLVKWSSVESMFQQAIKFDKLPINESPDLSEVKNMSKMFQTARNFNQPIDHWDVSNVVDMNKMFYWARNFNQPLNNWNVSNVVDMSNLFSEANFFNQSIEDWDVSSVKDMANMFRFTYYFNQPLNSWDISKVTNMSGMFHGASSFNQPIGDWDVSKVTNMSSMFYNAVLFNQDIGSWDVSSVTNMDSLFSFARSFNQPIEGWDVSNVTDMNSLFSSANSFNQPINQWNVSNVKDMRSMFYDAVAFNHSVDNWDVSNVVDMGFMFFMAYSFNQPIGNWDVSNVIDMAHAFGAAQSFNQPISQWNVSDVKDMRDMFFNAGHFNQSIGNWRLNADVKLDGMLDNSGLDCNNYSFTLQGWARDNTDVLNRKLGAGGMQYDTTTTDARNELLARGWTIIGDEPSQEPCGTISVNDTANKPVSIYPNPVAFELYVLTDDLVIDSYSISSVQGQTMMSEQTASTSKVTIDVSDLPTGMYIISIKADGKLQHIRFVKGRA